VAFAPLIILGILGEILCAAGLISKEFKFTGLTQAEMWIIGLMIVAGAWALFWIFNTAPREHTVPVGHKAIFVAFGKRSADQIIGEGEYIIPAGCELLLFDCREQTHDCPASETLSLDNVPLRYKLRLQQRIRDPYARSEIDNIDSSIADYSSDAARIEFSKRSALEFVLHSEAVATGIKDRLNSATSRWGVEVLAVTLSDLRLPQEIEKLAQVMQIIRKQHPDLPPKVVLDAIQSNPSAVKKLIVESNSLEAVAAVFAQTILSLKRE